ncbi:hypothetical protein FHR83_004713 [Actinoplanes campanulatus]|uniref:Uncharacterized protein n=1 Tax=Actinoplanes campanulatus TaxID=113559 RepID=A0A7W5AIR1_9ACTN|nr:MULTISPECIES: hypothetical protein [Actinoplanes]MBB3097038.1 hypothetical protein [Actinoplanes campanulatus]GGN15233.1 hypothetical protein GCM10010109_26960 [Actinoplanes campanulatus]GID37781.1 hypothetical protein Aca09nite_42870 [Actinoplanes campanulatus]GID43296.1 hypothetical protein Aca07nite_05710 [Actinoplanes capillaceus]
MYSLVSAPVLGFDLTRLEGGPAAAEVLLRALRLQAGDLPVLAERLPDEEVRGPLWVEVESAARRMPSLKAMSKDDPAGNLALVERAPIGTVDALLTCLRYDVMSWTWEGAGRAARQSEDAAAATALLCDAAVASYLREVLDDDTRRRLGAGWVAAVRKLPTGAPIDLGPHHYTVSSLLDRLRTLRTEDRQRVSTAADDARRNTAGWSPAVHSASWAAYLSDRVRTAAAAQMLLVQAVDTAGIPLADRAGGVWNMLSGAVQALVVRDLLDTATAHRLLAPVVAALGPAWLG